jgi:hypothetical protein
MKQGELRTPTSTFQDSIKAASEIGSMVNQYRDILKSVEIGEVAKRYRDSINLASEIGSIANQYRDILKLVEIGEVAKRYRDSIKVASEIGSMANQYRDILKSVEIGGAVSALRGAMKSVEIGGGMRQYRDALKLAETSHLTRDFLQSNGTTIDGLVESITPSAWPVSYSDAVDSVAIRNDSTLSVGATTLHCSEIQGLVDQIADKAFKQSESNIENAISAIIVEIRALRNPALEKILTYVLFPIIIGLIFAILNPIADYYIKERLTANERVEKKNIRKHIVTSIGDQVRLASYRFVSVKSLAVHLNPSAKSPTLEYLRFGQVVFLVEKGKDWSRVAWVDEDGNVAVQGWVFSRYLNKFR